VYGFKQLVDALASPLVIALLIASGALAVRSLGKRVFAVWMLLIAGAVAYLGSIELISMPLLASLERSYPPAREPPSSIRYIVVLGSDYLPNDEVPITSTLDGEGVVRVVEGVRLLRRLEHARLVVTGGPIPGRGRPSQGAMVLARELGVPESAIISLDHGIDTQGEARDVHALLGATPFLLVTSAYHMPRAMRLMQRTGCRPIPVPAAHRALSPSHFRWRSLLPSGNGLRTSERVIHEYLGLFVLLLSPARDERNGLGT
jgi:uncharacterized SAM-binding protein YcdF (DUF218 family)